MWSTINIQQRYMEHLPYTTSTQDIRANSWYIFMYVVLIHLYVISYITNRVLQIP